MPQFIVAAIAYIGTAIGGLTGAFLIMNAGLIASGALLIGGLALSSSARSKAKKKMREQYNASQVDRLVSIKTAIAPRELILGRVRKGGHVFFRGSVGQYKEKYVMLIAVAAHEIDAFEKVYFNDKEVVLDASGYVTSEPYSLRATVDRSLTSLTAFPAAPPEAIAGSVINRELFDDRDNGVGAYFATFWQEYVYTPKARVRWYLGAPGQSAAPDVIADFPGVWTAAHRARGVAYLHCEFWYDETAFPSGLPNVTALIRGAKIYDPRSGLTAWSENPALMQRHVLLHPQFGKRASLSSAEDARIGACANACDASHNYGDGAVALYRAALGVQFGTAAKDVLDDLAQSMAGSFAYAAGEFYCKAGVYTAPVMDLTEADVVRSITSSEGAAQDVPITVATHRSRNEKINVIHPRIYDAAQDYKQVALSPLKVAAYIARDGAELVEEVDLQAVGYAQQAHHIAGVMLRDARDPLTVSLTFKIKAWPLELFDVVRLTLPLYGWVAKEFEVRSRSYSPGQGVRLTLKETSASITQPDAAFPAQGFALNTVSPRPWDISPPSIVSITSGANELVKLSDGTIQSRVRVQWLPVLDASVAGGGQVEIEWQVAASDVKNSVRIGGSETQAYLIPVPDGQTIIIRARARSALAVSDWNIQQAHFVVGKTEPPANVESLQIVRRSDGNYVTFDRPPDIDYWHTWLRKGVSWNFAEPLGAGGQEVRVHATDYALGWLPAGRFTVSARHFDQSKNKSLDEASASITIAPPAPIVFTRSAVEANNLSLGWQDAKTSQPILRYEFKIGSAAQTFAQADNFGTKGADSRSDVLVSSVAGLRRVWVRAIDVAGNAGPEAYVDITFSLPTDFRLISDFGATFSGVGVNTIAGYGEVLMLKAPRLIDVHYSADGYANADAKIAAGKLQFLQNNATTASYSEEYNLGSVFATSTIAVTLQTAWVYGSGTIAVDIATKLNAGDAWITVPDALSIVAVNLRYVRITVRAENPAGNSLLSLISIRTQCSLRRLYEPFSLVLNAGDAGGTPYVCTTAFTDITLDGTFANAAADSSLIVKGPYPVIDDAGTVKRVLWIARDAAGNRVGGAISGQIAGV